MTLPIDPNNPDTNPLNNNPDTSPQNQPQDQAPPTNNNGGGQSPEMLQFYATSWQSERAERERLQRELEEARNRNNQPQPRDYSGVDPTFLERPATNIAEIVRREVAETIAPIAQNFNSFMQQQSNNTAYTNIKNQYRGSIANFNLVESAVDQLMATATVVDANTFLAAVRIAFGDLAMRGQLPNQQQNNNQNQNQNRNNPIPAQLPPSPPPAPMNNGGAPAASQIRLTEYENRMARERGMSPEEYIYWRDMPPEKVATSKGWDRQNNKPVE